MAGNARSGRRKTDDTVMGDAGMSLRLVHELAVRQERAAADIRETAAAAIRALDEHRQRRRTLRPVPTPPTRLPEAA